MNPKENFLRSIHYNNPEYVPLGCEVKDIIYSFQFEGNYKMGNWVDLWGVKWVVGIKGTSPFSKLNPLPDLSLLDDYKFPSADDLIFTVQMKEELSKINRDDKIVLGVLYYFLVERAIPLMGIENFLMSFYTHPKEMKELLHRIMDFNIDVFDRYLKIGVDGVAFSEDLGTQRSLLVSPQIFREFILPEYERCFKKFVKEGKHIDFHSCGCIEEIAGDIAGVGVTVLNPVQHSANNLEKIKKQVQGKMALGGAISTCMLEKGTPEDVREEVIQVMRILKPGGGYVCALDQGIPGIPEENIEALWKVAKEIGRY